MSSKTLDRVVSINTDDTLHKPNTNLLRSFVVYLEKKILGILVETHRNDIIIFHYSLWASVNNRMFAQSFINH